MANAIHMRLLVKIVRKETSYRRAEFERRRQTTVQGTTVWVAAPEDLVLSKLVWMRDTSPETEALFRRLLLERSADERMRMACEMFDTAKALIAASLLPDVAADPLESDTAVLRRLYEHELGATVIDEVVAAMRRRAAR